MRSITKSSRKIAPWLSCPDTSLKKRFKYPKSGRIEIRVNKSEFWSICYMVDNSTTGTSNISEFTRMLYAREWNRRHGNSSACAANQWQTDFRPGGSGGWKKAARVPRKHKKK